jgi:hypothetical protein
VSPVKYELDFYIQEDFILNSHRRENLKSYRSLDICNWHLPFRQATELRSTQPLTEIRWFTNLLGVRNVWELASTACYKERFAFYIFWNWFVTKVQPIRLLWVWIYLQFLFVIIGLLEGSVWLSQRMRLEKWIWFSRKNFINASIVPRRYIAIGSPMKSKRKFETGTGLASWVLKNRIKGKTEIVCEEWRLLGCHALWLLWEPTFRRT